MSTKTLYQVCPACVLGFILLLLAIASCTTDNDPTLYLTRTPAETQALVAAWTRTPGHTYFINQGTQSMAPAIQTGDHVFEQVYQGGPIPDNTIVIIDAARYNRDMRILRGDPLYSRWVDSRVQFVCHRSKDENETSIYVSGDNNRNSEGWLPKGYVVKTCPVVIRVKN